MDKVQKIREAVEKLKSNLMYGACSSQVAMETCCKEEAYNEVLAILDSMQEEPVSERFAFKAIPRLLEMIEPTDRAKVYIAKLADTLEIEGYTTDAKIVRESLKIMNGEKVPMATMDEELVMEDLKAEIKSWLDEGLPNEEELVEHIKETACHFAKWQEKQDQETIELAEDHAMLAGMEKMKEQMMAKAIDGYVIEDIEEGNGDFLLSADYLPKSMGLKDQQRVKVIVIKED